MHALTFQETKFDIVDRNGQPWLRSPQIAEALGYADHSSINRIFSRNSDEFTSRMTCSVKLTDQMQEREVRIFSLRGAHLLGMFARTKVAKEFRAWVLDVLEGIAEVKPKTQPKTKALPNGLTTDQQDAIKAMVKARVEALPQNKRAKAAITCWSALKSKFGCTYKLIDSENFTDAVSLVARLPLEGELLEPEPLLPATPINYPLEWLEQKNHAPLHRWIGINEQGKQHGRFSTSQLVSPDFNSPTRDLLWNLHQQGNDVSACVAEINAMRQQLEAYLSLNQQLQTVINHTSSRIVSSPVWQPRG
ncbi:BRO-N domain-containing protein [Thiopseudomonas alkaliphila]|uniref:BRO-N domain-containing protein n=1 Tax=Thiopseudomonas alkaliphila TaxID=1697053 RepID=UPI002577F419|nr:BRO family protein [Thiopseudomonas alkaliphila]